MIVNAVTHESSPVCIKFSLWDIDEHKKRIKNNQHNALRKIIMDNPIVFESEKINLNIFMKSIDGNINKNKITHHHIGSMIYNSL